MTTQRPHNDPFIKQLHDFLSGPEAEGAITVYQARASDEEVAELRAAIDEACRQRGKHLTLIILPGSPPAAN